MAVARGMEASSFAWSVRPRRERRKPWASSSGVRRMPLRWCAGSGRRRPGAMSRASWRGAVPNGLAGPSCLSEALRTCRILSAPPDAAGAGPAPRRAPRDPAPAGHAGQTRQKGHKALAVRAAGQQARGAREPLPPGHLVGAPRRKGTITRFFRKQTSRPPGARSWPCGRQVQATCGAKPGWWGVRVPGGMGRCQAGVGPAAGERRYPPRLPSPLTRRNGTAPAPGKVIGCRASGVVG